MQDRPPRRGGLAPSWRLTGNSLQLAVSSPSRETASRKGEEVGVWKQTPPRCRRHSYEVLLTPRYFTVHWKSYTAEPRLAKTGPGGAERTSKSLGFTRAL